MTTYEYVITNTSLHFKQLVSFYLKYYFQFSIKYVISHEWCWYLAGFLLILYVMYVYKELTKKIIFFIYIRCYEMFLIRWNATKLFKKQYFEYIFLSSVIYPIYLSFWYLLLSHYDYFYTYRIFELFLRTDLHPSRRILRRIIFRRFSRTATLKWYCLGHKGKYILPQIDKMIFFFIFLFILWNIYYIVATIFYEFDALIDIAKSTLILLIAVYFANQVGCYKQITKHYFRYIILGYYCKFGWLFWFILYIGANAVEDYSDEDEEIDFYNFSDEYMESDDIMERDFGGSEITAMFWKLGYYLSLVAWKIWQYTDIYHIIFAGPKARIKMRALERIHPRVLERFFMGANYNKMPRDGGIRAHLATKRKRNRGLLEIRQFSVAWRLNALEDTHLGRIVIFCMREPYFFIIRVYKAFLGEPFFWYGRQEKQYIKYWEKFHLTYFHTGGNHLDMPALEFDLHWSYEHRDFGVDTLGMNRRFLNLYAEVVNRRLFFEYDDGYDPGAGVDTKHYRADLRRYLLKISKHLLIIRLHNYQREIWKHVTNHDLKFANIKKRKRDNFFYNQILLGLFMQENMYVERKWVYFSYYFWRLRDIESVFYPIYTFTRKMIDEKYKSLGVWQVYHKYYTYKKITTRRHIYVLDSTTHVASSNTYKEIEQTHFNHYKSVPYGDDIEYMVYLSEYTHTSYFNLNQLKLGYYPERYYIKPIKNYKFNFIFLKYPRWRAFLEKKLNWPRQSIGEYTYEADPVFFQNFFIANIWTIIIRLENTSFLTTNKSHLFKQRYQYYNLKRLKKDCDLMNKYNYDTTLASEWWYTQIWDKFVKSQIKFIRVKALRPFRNWIVSGLDALREIWRLEQREFVALYKMYHLILKNFKSWVYNSVILILQKLKSSFFSIFKFNTYKKVFKFLTIKVPSYLFIIGKIMVKASFFEILIYWYLKNEIFYFLVYFNERTQYVLKLKNMLWFKDFKKIKNEKTGRSVLFSSNRGYWDQYNGTQSGLIPPIRTHWPHIYLTTFFKFLKISCIIFRETYWYIRLNEYDKMHVLNIYLQLYIQAFINKINIFYTQNYFTMKIGVIYASKKSLRNIIWVLKTFLYKFKKKRLYRKAELQFNTKNLYSRRWISYSRSYWFKKPDGKNKALKHNFGYLNKYNVWFLFYFINIFLNVRPRRKKRKWYSILYPLRHVNYKYKKIQKPKKKIIEKTHIIPDSADPLPYRWTKDNAYEALYKKLVNDLYKETGKLIDDDTRHELYDEMNKDSIIDIFNLESQTFFTEEWENEAAYHAKKLADYRNPNVDRNYAGKLKDEKDQ